MKNLKSNSLIITVVVAFLVGAAAFFGGMQYQKSQQQNRFLSFGGTQDRQGGNVQFGNGQGGGRRFNMGMNGRGVIGEITSVDDKSVTVKMMDGSSKIVILSDKTAINKQATGSKSDLKTGENIAVFGTSNSDGSVTAQNIQLNPQFGGRMMMPQPTK